MILVDLQIVMCVSLSELSHYHFMVFFPVSSPLCIEKDFIVKISKQASLIQNAYKIYGICNYSDNITRSKNTGQHPVQVKMHTTFSPTSEPLRLLLY